MSSSPAEVHASRGSVDHGTGTLDTAHDEKAPAPPASDPDTILSGRKLVVVFVAISLTNAIAIPDNIYAQEYFHRLFRSLKEFGMPVLSVLGLTISLGLLSSVFCWGRRRLRHRALYNKLSYYKALDLWDEAAKTAGCTKAELAYRWHSQISETLASLKRGSVGETAKTTINEIWKIQMYTYRWVAFDSAADSKYGNAVIFGATENSQISEMLASLKRGAVGEAAKAKINEIWKIVEQDAPLDNYNQ
ncbi:hypothetical protein B0H14DRAFT_3465880 [Mycena olivaceomarginata]|nr:hypothetical protein B0H14DRAFT_3465880 [Mycena olivaceomarginata]